MSHLSVSFFVARYSLFVKDMVRCANQFLYRPSGPRPLARNVEKKRISLVPAHEEIRMDSIKQKSWSVIGTNDSIHISHIKAGFINFMPAPSRVSRNGSRKPRHSRNKSHFPLKFPYKNRYLYDCRVPPPRTTG